MRYGMVIDEYRCIGCQTCAIACRIGNNLPIGLWYNRVNTIGNGNLDSPGGTYPNNALAYEPVACQHCANPLCVAACPTGASYIDEETGIVLIDGEACIGCRSCIEACPYDVRVYLESEPEYYVDHSLGSPEAPVHELGKVEKCSFCYGRIQKGEEPFCMRLCPGRARWYGDLDDPESEVSKLIASRDYRVLREEEGTQPSVYYV